MGYRDEVRFVICLGAGFYAQAHHLTLAVWALAAAAVIVFFLMKHDV